MSTQAPPTSSAPLRFVGWLEQNQQLSKTDNRIYNYLPRSDSHSLAICRFIIQDIVERCPCIREKAQAGKIAYGLNVRHTWPNGKEKALDLVIGVPRKLLLPTSEITQADSFARVLISCEAKNCMTEHGKSQPRLFDELSSSHEIVHQGDQECIAAGIAIINMSPTFVSPLRQRVDTPLAITAHRQPAVTSSMVAHLRGLPIRKAVKLAGFDAFASVVISCSNQGGAALIETAPAPQPGDRDHYDTFIQNICAAFGERFSDI